MKTLHLAVALLSLLLVFVAVVRADERADEAISDGNQVTAPAAEPSAEDRALDDLNGTVTSDGAMQYKVVEPSDNVQYDSRELKNGETLKGPGEALNGR